MPKLDPDDFLTISQCAQLKEVSRSAIYKAIKSKKLAFRMMLGRTVVHRSHLLAWNVRSGRQPGSPTTAQHRARISAALKKSWAERNKHSRAKR